MRDDSKINKLPVIKLFEDSLVYYKNTLKPMLLFSLINYFILLSLHYVGTPSNPAFLALAVVGYIFWAFFFRFYFDKKPYFLLKSVAASLAPSSKIMLIVLVFVTILMWLPLVPLLLGIEVDYVDQYVHFLEKYMEQSKAVDLGLNIIFLFVAPVLFYRPMFAWIASLIGRNGNLKFAWNKSQGNYWQIFLLVLIMNASFVLADMINDFTGLSWYVLLLIMAPLTVYFNVIIARSYEFLFIDN